MPVSMFRSVLRSTVVFLCLGLGLGCTSRNLRRDYLHNYQSEREILVREGALDTRSGVDAGVEPVDYATPIVSDDTVWIGSETRGVEAFFKKSLRKRWSFAPKNGVSSELNLIEDGSQLILLFGANDGYVYALDADTGKTLWKYEVRVPVLAKVTVHADRVYISTTDDTVHCLERQTGKWLWHYRRSGDYITTIHGNSSVVIDADRALVGFSDGYFVALNTRDGSVVWETKIHTGNKFTDVDASAYLGSQYIYIPSYDGDLYALARTTGKLVWHIEAGGARQVTSEDGFLYVPSNLGFVAKVDAESGRIVWKFDLDDGTPTRVSVIGNRLVFGASKRYLYTINKGDGSFVDRYNIGHRSGFHSNLALDGNAFYTLSNYGTLYRFRLND